MFWICSNFNVLFFRNEYCILPEYPKHGNYTVYDSFYSNNEIPGVPGSRIPVNSSIAYDCDSSYSPVPEFVVPSCIAHLTWIYDDLNFECKSKNNIVWKKYESNNFPNSKLLKANCNETHMKNWCFQYKICTKKIDNS